MHRYVHHIYITHMLSDIYNKDKLLFQLFYIYIYIYIYNIVYIHIYMHDAYKDMYRRCTYADAYIYIYTQTCISVYT